MESAHKAERDPAPLLEAIKCDRPEAFAGEVSYCVIEEPAEARGLPRRRTRLRTGKLLDLHNAFLAECQIYDRSPLGARIRLLAAVEVPSMLRLFEDEAGDIVDARLVWSRGREAGLRFIRHAGAKPLTPAQKTSLAGKYYAAGR